MATNGQAQEWFDEDCYACENRKNFYAKILYGDNFLQNCAIQGNKSTYQTGYVVAGSLGYYWCYGLSFEAEYAFRKNDIRKIQFNGQGFSNHGHLQTSSYMANLLWNLPLSSWGCYFWDIEPYIGAGIGYDFQEMHSTNSRIIFHQEWDQFSCQLMAGLTYSIICNTDIIFEYKFHRSSSHFYNHSLGIGLAYKFDFLY